MKIQIITPVNVTDPTFIVFSERRPDSFGVWYGGEFYANWKGEDVVISVPPDNIGGGK